MQICCRNPFTVCISDEVDVVRTPRFIQRTVCFVDYGITVSGSAFICPETFLCVVDRESVLIVLGQFIL